MSSAKRQPVCLTITMLSGAIDRICFQFDRMLLYGRHDGLRNSWVQTLRPE